MIKTYCITCVLCTLYIDAFLESISRDSNSCSYRVFYRIYISYMTYVIVVDLLIESHKCQLAQGYQCR
jgi:hypothetical protein